MDVRKGVKRDGRRESVVHGRRGRHGTIGAWRQRLGASHSLKRHPLN